MTDKTRGDESKADARLPPEMTELVCSPPGTLLREVLEGTGRS